MAVKQLKEDKNYVPLLDDEFSREEVHMAVKELMKINYVPVLDDEFPGEEINMAVKQIKEDQLCSCTRRRVF